MTASTTAGAVVFNLTESLLASNLSSYPAVSVASLGTLLPNLLAGQSLTGQAGSTGSTPLQVYVSAPQSGGIGNVSLQLVNYQDPSVGAGGELRGSGRWRSAYRDDGPDRGGHVLAGFRRCPRDRPVLSSGGSGRRDALRPDCRLRSPIGPSAR